MAEKLLKLLESLTTIEKYAFSGCSALKEIYIPDSVEGIRVWGFGLCFKLKRIHLPKNLTVFSDYILHDCFSLKKFEMPEKVKEIQPRAFMGVCVKKVIIPWEDPSMVIFNALSSVTFNRYGKVPCLYVAVGSLEKDKNNPDWKPHFDLKENRKKQSLTNLIYVLS